MEKSLALLQHADVVFLRKAGCVSCHNNSLTQMTLSAARKNGFAVDETSSKSELDTIRIYLETWREPACKTSGFRAASIRTAHLGGSGRVEIRARWRDGRGGDLS